MAESVSLAGMLSDVARECAMLRMNRRCRCAYGSQQCWGCRFNPQEYVDADPRHIRLLMLRAEGQAQAVKVTNTVPAVGFLVVLLIIGGLVGLGMHRAHLTQVRYEQAVGIAPKNAVPTTVSAGDIQKKLAYVAGELRKDRDVNGDGLVNCIDAAVLFYSSFPDKSKVRIMRNINPATGMNHLFNAVLLNGKWVVCEPQAVMQGYTDTWNMSVWGTMYDAKYDTDETDIWRVFSM